MKGPWVAHVDRSGWSVRRENDANFVIARQINGSGMTTSPEDVAHLLAAAPDLFSACEFAMGVLSEVVDDPSDEVVDDPSDRLALDKCIAAIAKARGECIAAIAKARGE